MRETRVLLLRHAETAAPDRFHGAESDIGLSATGRLQAEDVARTLAAEQPVALYSSAMRRARETAEPIGRACGLEATAITALHERRMGPLSNQPRDEFNSVYFEAERRWIAGDLEHTHDGGESYLEIRQRIVPPFLALAKQHPGQAVVVVVHGVVIRVLMTTLIEDLSPADFSRIGIQHVAVNDLRWNGERWRSAVFPSRDPTTPAPNSLAR